MLNTSLRLLRAFVVVSQEGNMRRAASVLEVAQPSLSQDIRRLEQHVGAVLFERSKHGMKLTTAGEKFLLGSTAALSLIERGVANAQTVSTTGRPKFVISFSPSIGERIVPRLLPLIDERLPHVDLEEREVDTGEVGPGVRDGRFDVGLAHCPGEDPSLETTLIAEEPLSVAVAASHPATARGRLHLAELEGLDLLLWPRATAPDYYDHIVNICTVAGLQPEVLKGARRAFFRPDLLATGRTFCLFVGSPTATRPRDVAVLPVEDLHAVVPLMFIRRSSDLRREVLEVESCARAISATPVHG